MALDFKKACASLQAALLELPSSGANGFEGFVRDAYHEATGISLRLQKSTTQGGLDEIADGSSGDVVAGIEAKRYRESTTLAVADLKTKLLDAATRPGIPIEFWILVASKEVSADDVGYLKKLGDEHGLGVLVLDWRSDTDALARFPLLLALAPQTVERVLGKALGDVVRTIAMLAEFETRKEQFLNEVRHPELGRRFAANQVKERVQKTLRSRADAKAKIQNAVDLCSSNCIWAPRDDACKTLQDWSRNPHASPICAIIGEEGAGKTWLMFDWWNRQCQTEKAPLVLWFAARDVTSSSLCEVLGAALAKWITVPQKTSAFWANRIDRWRRASLDEPNTPPIWLMLDGANEGSSQTFVAQLLSESLSSEWKGAVRILLSDRPGHWQTHFRSGGFLEGSPASIRLAQFSDAEFDALLSKHGKTRESFSPQVLRLIQWPSWFAVAATLFDKEQDWTAYSVDHLMLRYVQRRLSERPNISAMNDTIFRDFLSKIGAEVQSDWETNRIFSRSELKARLSGYTGEPEKDVLQALDEIVSGVWFRSDGFYQFEIDKAVLPCAIGLALLNDLKTRTTEEEADSCIERFLGPAEDQTIGVNTLAAAISLAFLDPTYASFVTRALLKRWLNSHNFSTNHFQLLWRLAAVNPAPLFDVAEQIWLARQGGSVVDELLIKSIVNVAEAGKQSDVVPFLSKLMRTYWLDPNEGEFISYHPTPEAQIAAASATEQRLKMIRHDIGAQAFDAFDLCLTENGSGASWACYRAFSIATYLPRAAQAPIWRGWVLSRAVMGRANHFDDLAWSLRVNPIDGAAAIQALLQTVDELLAVPSRDVHHQALSLLEAHGGPESAKKLASLGQNFQTRRWDMQKNGAELVNGVVTVSDARPNALSTITLLSAFALMSDARISAEHRELLADFADSFPVADLGNGRDRTSASLDLENAAPALARWSPQSLVALYQRFLSTVGDRNESRLLGLTFSLEKLLILLPVETKERIRSILVERLSKKDINKLDQIEHALIAAALFGDAPADQMSFWNRIDAPRAVLKKLKHLLRIPSVEQVASLEKRLASDQPVDRLAGWLVYLMLAAPKHLPHQWGTLAELLNHDDGDIREYALTIALEAEDSFLARRFYESDWTASKNHSINENWAGSSLLAILATPDNINAILSKVGPEWIANPWAKLEFSSEHADGFGSFLKASIAYELNPPASRSILSQRISHVRATTEIVRLKPDEFKQLSDKLFATKAPAFSKYEFPRCELVEAFMEVEPAQGAKYWTALREYDGFIRSTSEELDEMPFEAADGEDINRLRERLIQSASNDWMLLTAAKYIVGNERSEWAVSFMKHLLEHPKSPSDIARAITLSGYLDGTPAVHALWTEQLAEAPLSGWIGVVHQEAKENINRCWTSLMWLEKALHAGDDHEFFCYWQLFRRHAERNVVAAARLRVSKIFKTLPERRREFIVFNWDNVLNDANNSKSRLESTLFTFRNGHTWALPWAQN